MHHRGEVLVLDLLAGVLHQREQPRLGDARRRLRLLGVRLDVRRRDRDAARLVAPGTQRRQRRAASSSAPDREHGAPAGLHRACARGVRKRSSVTVGRALDALPHRGRMEGAEEAARDEVEDAAVVARERRARQRAGRDDREVIGDPGVVEDARLVLEPVAQQALRRGGA